MSTIQRRAIRPVSQRRSASPSKTINKRLTIPVRSGPQLVQRYFHTSSYYLVQLFSLCLLINVISSSVSYGQEAWVYRDGTGDVLPGRRACLQTIDNQLGQAKVEASHPCGDVAPLSDVSNKRLFCQETVDTMICWTGQLKTQSAVLSRLHAQFATRLRDINAAGRFDGSSQYTQADKQQVQKQEGILKAYQVYVGYRSDRAEIDEQVQAFCDVSPAQLYLVAPHPQDRVGKALTELIVLNQWERTFFTNFDKFLTITDTYAHDADGERRELRNILKDTFLWFL